MYVLDEPTIGLHQRDNARLIKTLNKLRNLGNTIIVVEHDEEVIRNSDWIIDLGPGAGVHGGNIVFEGTIKKILQSNTSVTGTYLKDDSLIILENKTPIFAFLSIWANCIGTLGNLPNFFCAVLYLNIK